MIKIKNSHSVSYELHMDRLPRSIRLDHSDKGIYELVLLDQTKLPLEETYLRCSAYEEVVCAIKKLSVRGAPGIGLSGAAAVVLWVGNQAPETTASDFLDSLSRVVDIISSARPTAVNLSFETKRIYDQALKLVSDGASRTEIAAELFVSVQQRFEEDIVANRAIGEFGADLLPDSCRLLTHCNAGSIACIFYGTALSMAYVAAERGKLERVYADETRPLGQGSRLTTWELSRVGIPVTLLCDNMAASLMASGMVDAIAVGADCIAKNGDTVNKIGTYGVAILAAYHHIPFYVAAPSSTFDLSIPTGSEIVIEQRDPSEVASYVPPGVEIINPAFDMTPASLITRIVTEKGSFLPNEASSAIL